MAPSCLWTGREFVTPQGKVGTTLTPLDFLPDFPHISPPSSPALFLSLSLLFLSFFSFSPLPLSTQAGLTSSLTKGIK